MELDTRRIDLVQAFNSLSDRVDEMTTDEIVLYTTQLKAVHVSSQELEETLKAEIKKRLDDGGKDGKGNTYFQHSNGVNGVKVEPRVKITLKEDAVEKLADAGYIGEFPLVPDPVKMAEWLRICEIDEHEYSNPHVTKEKIIELVDAGVIPVDFAHGLMNVTVSYAVKSVTPKALPENDG